MACIGSLLILASCSKASDGATSVNEMGTASFECSMLSSVDEVTRAENHFEIPQALIPVADDVELTINGTYIDAETEQVTDYSYGPLTLADYHKSQPRMVASADYHATFTHGTKGDEGESAPFFSGAIDFEVIARGKTIEPVTLKLENSIIALEFSDIFESYYTDAEFTVTTASDNSFEFTAQTLDKIVFVEPATTLTLSGFATKLRDGSHVTFNAVEIGSTTAQTLSRINITADAIGGEIINITLDDTITEVEPTEIELNPQKI